MQPPFGSGRAPGAGAFPFPPAQPSPLLPPSLPPLQRAQPPLPDTPPHLDRPLRERARTLKRPLEPGAEPLPHSEREGKQRFLGPGRPASPQPQAMPAPARQWHVARELQFLHEAMSNESFCSPEALRRLIENIGAGIALDGVAAEAGFERLVELACAQFHTMPPNSITKAALGLYHGLGGRHMPAERHARLVRQVIAAALPAEGTPAARTPPLASFLLSPLLHAMGLDATLDAVRDLALQQLFSLAPTAPARHVVAVATTLFQRLDASPAHGTQAPQAPQARQDLVMTMLERAEQATRDSPPQAALHRAFSRAFAGIGLMLAIEQSPAAPDLVSRLIRSFGIDRHGEQANEWLLRFIVGVHGGMAVGEGTGWDGVQAYLDTLVEILRAGAPQVPRLLAMVRPLLALLPAQDMPDQRLHPWSERVGGLVPHLNAEQLFHLCRETGAWLERHRAGLPPAPLEPAAGAEPTPAPDPIALARPWLRQLAQRTTGPLLAAAIMGLRHGAKPDAMPPGRHEALTTALRGALDITAQDNFSDEARHTWKQRAQEMRPFVSFGLALAADPLQALEAGEPDLTGKGRASLLVVAWRGQLATSPASPASPASPPRLPQELSRILQSGLDADARIALALALFEAAGTMLGAAQVGAMRVALKDAFLTDPQGPQPGKRAVPTGTTAKAGAPETTGQLLAALDGCDVTEMTVQLLWGLYSHWLAASGCGLAPHRQRQVVDVHWVAEHPLQAHQLLQALRSERASVIPEGHLFGATALHVAHDIKALTNRRDRLTELFDGSIDRLETAIARAASTTGGLPMQSDAWQGGDAAGIDTQSRPGVAPRRAMRTASRGFDTGPAALPDDMATWAEALRTAARDAPTRLAGMVIAKYNELDGPGMPASAWRALWQALFLEAGPVVPTKALARLMGVALKWAHGKAASDASVPPRLSGLVDVVVWAHRTLPPDKCAALSQALLSGEPRTEVEDLLALQLRLRLACATAEQDGPRSAPRLPLGKLSAPELQAVLIDIAGTITRRLAGQRQPADVSQAFGDAGDIAWMQAVGQWLASGGLEGTDASALLGQLTGPGTPDPLALGLQAGIVADALGGRHIDPDQLDRLAHALIQSLLDAPAPRVDRKGATRQGPEAPSTSPLATRALWLLAKGVGEPVTREANRVRLLRAILAATAQPTSSSTTTSSSANSSAAAASAHAFALRGPLVWGLGLALAHARARGLAAAGEPHDPAPVVLMLAQETRTLRPFEQASLLEGLFTACGRLPAGALPGFFDELKTVGIHEGARAALMAGAIEADPARATLSVFAQARAALFDAMRGNAPVPTASSSSSSSSLSRPLEPPRPDTRLLATLERRLDALYASFEVAAVAATSTGGLDTAGAWVEAARRNLRALDHLPWLPQAQRQALAQRTEALIERLSGKGGAAKKERER